MEMFRLDKGQEMAMAMWDPAPGPEPISEGGSGYACKANKDGKRPECMEKYCCGTASKEGKTSIEICHVETVKTYTGRDKIEMNFECGA